MEPMPDGAGQPLARSAEDEIKELLGLADTPAFVRRGHEVEDLIRRIKARCAIQRLSYLEMVHLRLRQWSQAAAGPGEWQAAFAVPIHDLWPATSAPEPEWAGISSAASVQRAIARDLVASLQRFNRRWCRFLTSLKFEPLNELVANYNRFYLMEKEMVLGSPRLAKRNFVPMTTFGKPELLREFPLVRVPELTPEAHTLWARLFRRRGPAASPHDPVDCT